MLIRPAHQLITTTSSLPTGTVQYPSLMSQHQVSQGYHPSLSSMFHRPSHASHAGLLFQAQEAAAHHHFYQHLPKKSQATNSSYAQSTRPPPLPPKELVAPALGGTDPVS